MERIVAYNSKWSWQSDSNPWKEPEQNLWTWTPYSEELSKIIERAFICNKKSIEIPGYEIDLCKMLQINKSDKNKIRRIQRNEQFDQDKRLLIDMPPPKNINEKTYNNPFGNVELFLNYIMKRTPESYQIFLKLEKLKLDSKQTEFQDIVDLVKQSIEKGAENREKIVQTRVQSKFTPNYIEQAQVIKEEIDKEKRSFKNFLILMLKIYSMETFVCYWLNELLRTENWEEINILTPYLVCLIYAFSQKDAVFKQTGFFNNFSRLLNTKKSKKLILYRGTALFKEHIDLYNPDVSNIKFFSWNQVTSTTRQKPVALNFMKQSYEKAQRSGQNKFQVLFEIIIEDDSAGGFIDISSNSKFPEEEELVLAPATVFQIMYLYKTNEDCYEITLKMKNAEKDMIKDVELLGNIQKDTIYEKECIFDSIHYEKMLMALELLIGNQIIENIRLVNPVLDKVQVNTILKSLETLPKLKEILLEIKQDYLSLSKSIKIVEVFSNSFEESKHFMSRAIKLCFVFDLETTDMILLSDFIARLVPISEKEYIQIKNLKLRMRDTKKDMLQSIFQEVTKLKKLEGFEISTEGLLENQAINSCDIEIFNLTSRFCNDSIKLLKISNLGLDFSGFKTEYIEHTDQSDYYKAFISIINSLVPLKTLKILTLGLPYIAANDEPDQNQLKGEFDIFMLLDRICALSSLESLKLDVSAIDYIDPLQLFQVLTKHKTIKSFELIFSNYHDISNLLSLDTRISKLTLKEAKGLSNELKSVFQRIKKFSPFKKTSEQSLTQLSIQGFYFRKSLGNLLAQLTNLKSLEIILPETPLQRDGMKKIYEALAVLDKLESFTFINGYNLANHTYRLDGEYRERFNGAYENTWLLVRRLTNLKALRIGTTHICSPFLSFLPNLQNLSLELYDDIDKVGLDTLSADLENVPNLKHFSLKSSDQYMVLSRPSENNLLKFSSSLSNLKALVELRIGIHGTITEEGARIFIQDIKKISSLRKIPIFNLLIDPTKIVSEDLVDIRRKRTVNITEKTHDDKENMMEYFLKETERASIVIKNFIEEFNEKSD